MEEETLAVVKSVFNGIFFPSWTLKVTLKKIPLFQIAADEN